MNTRHILPLIIALLTGCAASAQNTNFTNITIASAGAIKLAGGGPSATISGAGGKVITSDLQALTLLLTSAGGLSSSGNLNITSPGSIGFNAGVAGTFQFNRALALTVPLSADNGGTGAATFTQYGILYGNGTSPFGVTGTGTSGQVLTSNGSGAAPTFQTVAAGGGISGATTGDIIVATSATTGTSKPAQINSSGDITARNVTGATVQGTTFVSTTATSYTSTGNMNITSPGSIGINAGSIGTIQFNKQLVLTVPLDAGNGGLGTTTLTAHGVVIGNGTSTAHVTSAGTAGQVLTSNGSGADPTFQSGGGGSGTVTSVATGTGLTGGTITTTGTVSLSVPVQVTSGGTGLVNIPSTQIMIGNGTGAVTATGNLTADASGNVTSGGVLTFTNASGGVAGQTNGSVPVVGIVGYVSGVGLASASAISLTSNTPVNIVSHTFPAGHFIVWANGWYLPGSGTTFSFCVSGLSTSSGSLPGVDSAAENQNSSPFCSAGIAGTLPIVGKSFSFSTPTTVYLVSASVFSGGTMSAFGGMTWEQLQ